MICKHVSAKPHLGVLLVPLDPYIKVFFLYLFLSDRSVCDTIQLEDRFLCFLFRPSKIQDGRHFLTKIKIKQLLHNYTW